MKRLVPTILLGVLAGCGGGGGGGSTNGGDTGGQTGGLYEYTVPVATGDGWRTASLESAGIDEETIVDMIDSIKGGNDIGFDSVLIARDGQLVLEEYMDSDYDQDDVHEMMSVGKSAMSLLTGAAIHAGYIPDVSQKVLPLFPDYSPPENWDDRKNDISIEHLLTMSTGLDCDDTDPESVGREPVLVGSDDWVKAFLDLPMVRDPGAEFRYCTGNGMALAGVIEASSGMSSGAFADQFLFDKLGIGTYTWKTGPKGRLFPNGLYLRPREAAKIGQVMLDGTWNSMRIVSQEWIEASSTRQISDQDGDSYGYTWSLTSVTVGEETIDVFFAYGNGGQSITVIPSRNTVVVTTGSIDSMDDFDAYARLIVRYVVPALQ